MATFCMFKNWSKALLNVNQLLRVNGAYKGEGVLYRLTLFRSEPTIDSLINTPLFNNSNSERRVYLEVKITFWARWRINRGVRCN